MYRREALKMEVRGIGMLYILVVPCLQFQLYRMGKDKRDCLIDLVWFSCISTVSVKYGLGIPILLELGYMILEMYSLKFFGAAISLDFIGILNPGAAVKQYRGFLFEAIVLTCLLSVIAFIPKCHRCLRKSEGRGIITPFILLACIATFGYAFIDKLMKGLFPYAGRIFFDKTSHLEYKQVDEYFGTPLSVSMREGHARKNLLYLLVESFERQILGNFSYKGFTKAMPFVTHLLQTGTFIPNVLMPARTSWSSASIFATFCGMPLMFPVGISTKDSVFINKYSTSFKCLGDVYKKLGYDCHAMYVGDTEFDGVDKILQLHGFENFYNGDSGLLGDEEMTQMFERKIGPLSERYFNDGVPFALVMGFEDTHPSFTVRNCTPRADLVGDSRGYQSFDCVDQRLERIMRKLQLYGLNASNTEVILHGDHMVKGYRGHTKDWLEVDVPRILFVGFPFGEKQWIHKRINLYDVVPTLLDRMGIDFKPKFPFGGSAYGDSPLSEPDEDLMGYINYQATRV